MELTLPLMVLQQDRRLVEAWLPTLSGIRASGPSLAEIRDDLAFAVMERFYKDSVSNLGDYQIAPSSWVEHILVERTIYDPVRKKRWEVRARLGMLIEKWPGASFLVVTPTRLPISRFSVLHEECLEVSVIAQVTRWCLEKFQTTLDPWHSKRRERLEVLQVDAIPPTLLPHTHPSARRFKSPATKSEAEGLEEEQDPEDPESPPPKPISPEELEEKRRIARLTLQVLRRVGRNLSHAVEDNNLGRASGRDGFVDRLVDDLATREGAAIVLVGPPGVGKSAIIHEFVRRLSAFNKKNGLRRDVWQVDGNRFISGMKFVGQWESRAREMITELEETGDILFLDDLASMVQAGRTGKSDTHVAQFLGPAVARGQLTLLAESTPERLAWAREQNPGFVQLFRIVPIFPMSMRESLLVLIGVLRRMESETSSLGPRRVSPSAMEATLQLTERFLPNEAFPGKAVRLMQAALDRDVEPTPNRRGWIERRYGPMQIQAALQQRTGLPDFILDPKQALSREEIRARFQRFIAGQQEAIHAMSDLVLALQQGLCDPEKPLGVFLFVGPTGVGKTESARALARILFDSPERMIRFDMSEFTSASSISRLIGSPDAPDGELTSALRVQPFCVVLFDEIEKAHPRVFDALLQLLGEGRLSDASGRLADARQAVLVMTSNLGVREAATRVGFTATGEEARAHYLSAVQCFFRPEFFNRMDRIVPFRSLEPEALRRVVDLQLADLLGRRGITQANLLVEVEAALLDVLVERAYDPRFGARPLKREMERQLTVPLAHHLVRRRSNDLTLVMLQRLGNKMSLQVRALHEQSYPFVARSAPDSPEACDAIIHSLSTMVDKFQQVLIPLLEQPSGNAGLDLARTGLLDEIHELQRAIHHVELDPILTDKFEEQEIAPTKLARVEQLSGDPSRHRFRGGLRLRSSFNLVSTYSPPAMLLHRAQTLLLPLLDTSEVLASRARAATSLEHWTLLFEPLPGMSSSDLHYMELLDELCSLLQVSSRQSEFHQGGSSRWVDASSSGKKEGNLCRNRLILDGFALSPLVTALTGFAVSTGDLRTPLIVRIHAFQGENPDALISTFDSLRQERLAQRHLGEDIELPDVPDRISFRYRESWSHVPTGLTFSSRLARVSSHTFAAAILRLQSPGEGLSDHG